MPSRFIVSCTARAVGTTCGETFALDVDEHVGRDRLDLGHDELRPFLLDQPLQRRRVGHRDHVRAVRDLVPRRVGVAIDGDDLDAEALQRDDDFLAELAAAEQHDPGGGRGERGADVHGRSDQCRRMAVVEAVVEKRILRSPKRSCCAAHNRGRPKPTHC